MPTSNLSDKKRASDSQLLKDLMLGNFIVQVKELRNGSVSFNRLKNYRAYLRQILVILSILSDNAVLYTQNCLNSSFINFPTNRLFKEA